jgi:hypothetical protein
MIPVITAETAGMSKLLGEHPSHSIETYSVMKLQETVTYKTVHRSTAHII